MSDWVYVAAAYGLTWITLVAYSFSVLARRRKAARNLKDLEQ